MSSVAAWLAVRGSRDAVDFYKRALNAVEVYLLDGDAKGVVARLSADGAEFWISEESPENGSFSPQTLGASTVRMILTVPDPDASFALAIAAGATVVHPVIDMYGWRVGRVVDPFGHHWEIGRPLDETTP